MRAPSSHTRSGLIALLGSHLIWGLLPLYLLLVRAVPPLEFVGLRIVLTLPFCLAFIQMRGSWGELLAALADRAIIARLLVSALLIACNWLLYVYAIHAGQVYAASFGYYISPLVQVAAGTVLLGERLSRMQWAAVACAALGVAVLGWGEARVLVYALAIALSWSIYGLVRRFTAVTALPGLTIETLLLTVPAWALLVWLAPGGSSLNDSAGLTALIVLSGLLTAAPLILFAYANERLDFSTIGMLQFSSPTLVFILGVTVFDQPLEPAALIAFTIIWAAIGLFVWDLLARQSAEQSPA